LIEAMIPTEKNGLGTMGKKYRNNNQFADRSDLQKYSHTDSIAAISGGIAHDYNNLLTAIIGNISLAQTYLSKTGKPFSLLSQALAASQAARKLTDELISFSKGRSPNRAITPVERLVRNVVDFTLSGSNIKCNYNFAPDLRRIDVDRSQISQALHHVVINAREAMPKGGFISASAENVRLDSAVPSLKAGNYVRICITDHGDGIAEDDIHKIFEPYYSTKSTGNRKAAGLGLPICNSIIENHGGMATVSSQIGRGTALSVFLPAAPAGSPAGAPDAVKESAAEIYGQGKILVMDDEAMIRELAGEILQYLGYRVEFAQDGAEAVASYTAAFNSPDPFDAVILDLTVRGGMGGLGAINKLKAIDPRVKSIVSSGYSEDPGMTGFEDYGFCSAVAKPYTLEELGEILSAVLH
jgi:nitrogen-specific signal transduction histidine kinase/CheY-like chemotaxis protein